MTRTNGQVIPGDLFVDLPAPQLATALESRLQVHLSTAGSASVRSPDDDARPGEAGAVLSVPIRLRAGAVGAVHLVGPCADEFVCEDGDRLRSFATDVGAAYERFLRRRPTGGAPERGLRLLLGVAAMVVGLLLVLGAAWALEARALPLSRLPGRPAAWWGAALSAVGLLVVGARRRPHGRVTRRA
jgi:hypothetical protein